MDIKDKKLMVLHPGYRDNLKELYTMILNNFNSQLIFIKKGKKDKFDKKHQNQIDFLGFESVRASMLSSVNIIKLIRVLYQKIKYVNPDVILTSTEHPIHSKVIFIFSKIFRKKLIIWTESWCNKEEKYLIKLYHDFSKYMLKKSDSILVHGKNQKSFCLQQGIDEKKIFVFPFAINDLKEIEANHNIEVPSNKIIILYIGRLIKLKGIEILLKAFKKLEESNDNIYLLIVGKGEDERYFKKLSNRLKIKNVKFFGYLENVKSAYKVADIFVLPTYFYKHQGEGWGLVINEATSMGLPVITTDAVGASKDLVKNGKNGYIVKNGNVYMLFKAMKKIVNDDKMRKEMGINSRNIFEKYNDIEKSKCALQNAIQKAIYDK